MYVKYYFFTECKFNTKEKAQALLDLLLQMGGIYVPQKYSENEPINRGFDPSDLKVPIAILSSMSRPDRGNILLKRDKPVKWLMGIDWNKFSSKLHRNYMLLDERYFEKDDSVSQFLRFAKEVYCRFGVVYASAGLEREYDDKNVVKVKERMGSLEAMVTRYYGDDISQQLPGVYWANFFGKRYADLFGEKLNTVVAFKKELLPDGGSLILTSASPLEYPNRQVVESQEDLKKSLGEEMFFNKSNPELY
jgi:hypothetical protein